MLLENDMTQSTQQTESERWDDDGGSPVDELTKMIAIEKFERSEQHILAFLGASLLCFWDDLPQDARQKLLNRELVQKTYDESVVKSRIAGLFK